MRKLFLAPFILFMCMHSNAQRPCSDPVYRQFDFWLGNWEAYALNGKKAGDSKISMILDSCIVLEEWTSASQFQGVTYTGKSFNTYNSASKQWQQCWVDNVGGSTQYLKGKKDGNKMVFQSDSFQFSKDTTAIRRLTFYDLTPDKVRQHGEITKDGGASWRTEYDLEYRRKK